MVSFTGNLDGNSMTTSEIVKGNSRSESAKKMWERRKAQIKEKETDVATTPPIRAWVYHTEWFALMATVIGCFLYVHKENVHLTDRLDGHIEQINRRVDESNAQLNRRCDELSKRSDDLHKEFYDLLKEMRNDRGDR